ncbi:MAG: DUF1553 domain-containing protein, partial [Chlorobia bacterium]|nr:DUF1553 domain-containing protein [Fimbriimonadaceae bacterium]
MRIRSRSSHVLLLGVSLAWLATAAFLPSPQVPPTDKVSYSRDVLPILSDKCFLCHGPDSGSRMAGLRLDTPEGAFANRSGRFAIVPGKPEHSLMAKRITHPSMPMPPKGSGKTLTKREIDILKRWIAQGAPYGKLWSFEPLPAKVLAPAIKSDWPRNEIDRFVLARLNKAKLAPSQPAPRLRWLRRVTYDLTGLPPTEKEIADFQSDSRPDAYERVVDRLLASSRYGERLAVAWLDAARYSDSYGYQSDLLMPSWPYRDWVIKAFNRNLPYNQFLIEQLAGDLLPNPTRDQRLATAFNRLHRQSNEGGSIALEFKTEYAVDRVDTYGTAVLGLTLGCARCHDHKFDPISQREFYQFFAYFNSIEEYGLLLSTEIVPTPSLLLPTPEQEARFAQLKKQNVEALASLEPAIDRADAQFQSWKARNPTVKTEVTARLSFDTFTDKFPSDAEKVFGVKLGSVDLVAGRNGKAVLLDGDNGLTIRGLRARERWEPFTWSFWVQDPRQKGPVVLLHRTGGTDVGFCGFDLMLEDGYLTARVMRHWPGNAVAIRTTERIPKGGWQQIAWQWDGSGRAEGLRLFTNGQLAKTTVLKDKLWKKIYAYGDHAASGGDWTFGNRFRDAGFKGGKIDDIAFADRILSGAEIANLYDGRPIEGSGLREFYATSVEPGVKESLKRINAAQKELAEFEEGIREVSVMEESPAPIPAHVLARGQYDAPRTAANQVMRNVPKVLPALGKPVNNNRLALAKWTTSPIHPLTARVAVNRFWQMLFGTGLVETSENFGTQGARPTHPELLDYLARRFVDSGWNNKVLLKMMVLSATYRQDSVRKSKVKDIDPDNRLYSRGPSHRLSAEMVRDTALSASGLLNDKLGGPPVNPYQPAGIWQENNTMSPGFVQSKGADLYRRSLYSTWKRTTPVPSMLLFDATSREACTVRRPSTNTPLQALVLLNDPTYIEASRKLAERVLREAGPTAEERITFAFRLPMARKPTADETAVLK